MRWTGIPRRRWLPWQCFAENSCVRVWCISCEVVHCTAACAASVLGWRHGEIRQGRAHAARAGETSATTANPARTAGPATNHTLPWLLLVPIHAIHHLQTPRAPPPAPAYSDRYPPLLLHRQSETCFSTAAFVLGSRTRSIARMQSQYI